jgi:hypothetical protein
MVSEIVAMQLNMIPKMWYHRSTSNVKPCILPVNIFALVQTLRLRTSHRSNHRTQATLAYNDGQLSTSARMITSCGERVQLLRWLEIIVSHKVVLTQIIVAGQSMLVQYRQSGTPVTPFWIRTLVLHSTQPDSIYMALIREIVKELWSLELVCRVGW